MQEFGVVIEGLSTHVHLQVADHVEENKTHHRNTRDGHHILFANSSGIQIKQERTLFASLQCRASSWRPSKSLGICGGRSNHRCQNTCDRHGLRHPHWNSHYISSQKRREPCLNRVAQTVGKITPIWVFRILGLKFSTLARYKTVAPTLVSTASHNGEITRDVNTCNRRRLANIYFERRRMAHSRSFRSIGRFGPARWLVPHDQGPSRRRRYRQDERNRWRDSSWRIGVLEASVSHHRHDPCASWRSRVSYFSSNR